MVMPFLLKHCANLARSGVVLEEAEEVLVEIGFFVVSTTGLAFASGKTFTLTLVAFGALVGGRIGTGTVFESVESQPVKKIPAKITLVMNFFMKIGEGISL
jgi:hypothetical protein